MTLVFYFTSTFLFFIVLGVHCSIYKSSYNIFNVLYLNSHPPHHSLSSPFPHTWKSLNRHHFSIYIFMYIIFAPYSTFQVLSPHPPYSHCYQLPRQDLFCPLVLQFCKRKTMTFLFTSNSYTGSFQVTFPCIYVL
jgi:hypothetical protein